MGKRKKSPCIDVCNYHGPKGWCIGCALTRTEIKNWKNMKPYDRNLLMNQLPRRKSEMKNK